MKMETSGLNWRAPRRGLQRRAVLVAIITLLLLLGLAGALFQRARSAQVKPAAAAPTTMPLPEALARPFAFKPLTVEQAINANSELPFTKRRDVAAREFILKADSDNRGRAIDCLAQAVFMKRQ